MDVPALSDGPGGIGDWEVREVCKGGELLLKLFRIRPHLELFAGGIRITSSWHIAPLLDNPIQFTAYEPLSNKNPCTL